MQSVSGTLWEWLSALEADERLALSVVVMALSLSAAVLVVAIVAYTIRAVHKHRLDDALKRELLDRGLTAEEIALVVQTKSGRCGMGSSGAS
jgi:mannose/fructose/N-acetylgalactosamine-specific phosphotransferase system component IIC